MKINEAYDLANLLEGEGYDAVVDDHYSGRGMYGKTTPAIVTNAPSLTIGLMAQTIGITEIPTRMDSMGLSTVHY